MDPLTKKTADDIMNMLRDINPHKHQPTNVQLAWATGYLVGMMASLCQDDNQVKHQVRRKLTKAAERSRFKTQK